ncbi:metallophosphoesterase, partial [Pseudomonas savastanoi]
MFHVMFSLPCLYVIARFLWPMPWALSARIAVALLLVLASQYHLYCRFSSGSVFSPEFPRTVVMLFNWAFGAILLLAVLQIIVDIATLLTMLMRRQALTIPANLRYVIGVAALALAAIGVQQAVRVPPVKDIQIAIKNLPVQFEGYKVLQLTDMHISRLFDAPWTQAVVQQSNALGVNLIVITGDLIDGSLNNRKQDVEALRDLRAPDGVYVIPGNHEYFFDNQTWMQHFVSLGMVPLANSHTLIERDG